MEDKNLSFDLEKITKDEFITIVYDLEIAFINDILTKFQEDNKWKTPISSYWDGFRKGSKLPKTKVNKCLGTIYDEHITPLSNLFLHAVLMKYNVNNEKVNEEGKIKVEEAIDNITNLEVNRLFNKLVGMEKTFSFEEVQNKIDIINKEKEEEITKLIEKHAKEIEDIKQDYSTKQQDLEDKITDLKQEINEINFKYTDSIKDKEILRKENDKLKEELEELGKVEVFDDSDSNYDTLNVLSDFNKYLQEKGLSYSKIDVYRFHFSLITRKITVLAGAPGIGKSKLALEYANFFNLSVDKGNLLFLPISPSYTEPSDILGFLSPKDNTYVSTEANLARFLVHAQNNPNEIHMLVFDEMNLAQIEYYFAPFLSNLETDDKTISLYASDIDAKNKDIYPNKVKLLDNLLIVGTINKDETTNELSQRLLDRIYLINLEEQNFVIHHNNQKVYRGVVSKYSYDINKFIPRLATKEKIIEAMPSKLFVLLDDLNIILKQDLMPFYISYRNLYNMGLLLYFIDDNLDIKEAIDIIFLESIVSKVCGSSLILNDIIDKIITKISDYKGLSDFNMSINRLNIKKRELEKYGYTR